MQRQGKRTEPHRYLSVRLPHSVVEALSALADRKGVSRNALIIQTLRKATVPRAKKRKGE